MSNESVLGYDQPSSVKEFDQLQRSVMFTDDGGCLKNVGEILGPQIDGILDFWYGFVGDHNFLLYYLTGTGTGVLDEEYLERLLKKEGFHDALVHRGGFRTRIVTSGMISVGNQIVSELAEISLPEAANTDTRGR